MSMEIVTKDDLELFRKQLLRDIRELLRTDLSSGKSEEAKGYKTKDLRRILGCSVNKLVSVRITRKIRWKKVGGTVYYNREDVRRLVEEGF
jgi:hypothetical protein